MPALFLTQCFSFALQRGLTALHVAASRDFGPIVALLLFAGANPSAVDLEGHTPLHSSARSGCIDAARMLIAAGSPLDAADGRGLTPLHAAYESHHDEVATVLEEAGAHADLRDLAGRTPCESAVALEVEARAVARVGFDTLRLPAVNTGRLKTPPPIPRAKVEEAGPVIVAPPPVAIKPNPFRAQAEKAKG